MWIKLARYAPCHKEWLVKVIEDVEHDVIVAGGVDVGSRKLAIDENSLLGDSEGRDGSVGDIPCEVQVRVFTVDHRYYASREAEQQHIHHGTHLSYFTTIQPFPQAIIISVPYIYSKKKILGSSSTIFILPNPSLLYTSFTISQPFKLSGIVSQLTLLSCPLLCARPFIFFSSLVPFRLHLSQTHAPTTKTTSGNSTNPGSGWTWEFLLHLKIYAGRNSAPLDTIRPWTGAVQMQYYRVRK